MAREEFGLPLLRCWRVPFRCTRRLQPQRHTWVNDPGLCAVHPARAAAAILGHRARASRRPGRPRQPNGVSARQRRPPARHRVRPGQSVTRLQREYRRQCRDTLIGSVRARGLSTVQLGLDIEAELRRKSIKDPKVSVEVDAYRPFFIRRGQYPYVNAMTVEGAVATAEVYTEREAQCGLPANSAAL